jgi:bifunctional DNase/RNase
VRVKEEICEVNVRGLVPSNNGVALFIGNPTKVFFIYVDTYVGNQLACCLGKVQKERPMTHDLMHNLMVGFNIEVQRTVIVDIKDGVFFGRLVLKMSNEINQKLVELDARPSDAILLALQANKPIFVTKKVIDEVSDASEWLQSQS